ncbi:hypothetical protein QJS10_CPA08g00470 [Acorus calamus]|uniref:Uncharacterized protein n=1 Tax=Acorus calamus TaxID=4465 RepID=A0AAV9EA51_ACOCL|nr:hypothetical protein QJS10_CPA08g00470 [Acorus calamus]
MPRGMPKTLMSLGRYGGPNDGRDDSCGGGGRDSPWVVGLDEQIEDFILEKLVHDCGTPNSTQNPTPTSTAPSSSNATRS